MQWAGERVRGGISLIERRRTRRVHCYFEDHQGLVSSQASILLTSPSSFRFFYHTSFVGDLKATMQSPRIQINMHRPNSWVYTELGIQTLALVLKSGITIARPDPKADAQLQVTPTGSFKGGSIKVIVVSSTYQSDEKYRCTDLETTKLPRLASLEQGP